MAKVVSDNGRVYDRDPSPLGSLLAELPSGVRAAVDTTVFAAPEDVEPGDLRRLAEVTASHVVAYDLRIEEKGLPLCTVVGQAYLAPERMAALHAAERVLPSWISLVAYARPAEMRHSEEVILEAAEALRDRRAGEA